MLDPFDEYSPDSLTRFYKGLPLVSLHGGFEEIIGQLRKLRPRLIHVAAQFHDEERTNESGFQLSPDGPLTRAVDIAEILRATPDFAPIIILEPLWQPSDLGRQLLLRNHFAGTLAKFGAPAAVIAIGPYPSREEPPALLRELADPTTTPRRIYEALFAAAQRPYLPALFADDPDEPIWSPPA